MVWYMWMMWCFMNILLGMWFVFVIGCRCYWKISVWFLFRLICWCRWFVKLMWYGNLFLLMMIFFVCSGLCSRLVRCWVLSVNGCGMIRWILCVLVIVKVNVWCNGWLIRGCWCRMWWFLVIIIMILVCWKWWVLGWWWVMWWMRWKFVLI